MRISDWSSDMCSSDLRLRKVMEKKGRRVIRRPFSLAAFFAIVRGWTSPVRRRTSARSGHWPAIAGLLVHQVQDSIGDRAECAAQFQFTSADLSADTGERHQVARKRVA